MNDSNQITILGAGVVGLSQALHLLKNGLKVTIIDKFLNSNALFDLKPDIFDARVFALTPQTTDFLDNLGVWSEILSLRVCPYYHMSVWDGKGSGKIRFDAQALGVSELGHIVEQPVILQALLKQAQFYINNGQLVWLAQEPKELVRDNPDLIGVKLSDNSIVYAQLLIGADGANSWLRTTTGLPIVSQDYHQTAIVATVSTEHSHNNTAYQRFSEGGPLALLPLSEPNKVSIVWTQGAQTSQELLSLSEHQFNHKLTEFSENILGKLSLVGAKKGFALKNQQAQSYGSDRVVLIGDSAHVIHPLAGLGANLGFQDVFSLSRLILKQKNNQRDLGSNSLIQRYYRERIAKNEAVRHSMTGLNKLFSSQNPLVKLLRNWGIDKANAQSALKKWFANQAMGLS